MSKVKIEGNASGTGTLTIAAPNTNTDRTLTLPDGAGEILSSGTNSNFPAGSVLQVKHFHNTTYTQATTPNTTTWYDTGATVSITPSSTSSKIWITWSESVHGDVDTDGQDTRGAVRLLRDSTSIIEDATGSSKSIISRGGQQNSTMSTLTYLDSPNTTSSVTYKAQFLFYNTAGSRNFRVNYNKLGTITVMEIAG